MAKTSGSNLENAATGTELNSDRYGMPTALTDICFCANDPLFGDVEDGLEAQPRTWINVNELPDREQNEIEEWEDPSENLEQILDEELYGDLLESDEDEFYGNIVDFAGDRYSQMAIEAGCYNADEEPRHFGFEAFGFADEGVDDESEISENNEIDLEFEPVHSVAKTIHWDKRRHKDRRNCPEEAQSAVRIRREELCSPLYRFRRSKSDRQASPRSSVICERKLRWPVDASMLDLLPEENPTLPLERKLETCRFDFEGEDLQTEESTIEFADLINEAHGGYGGSTHEDNAYSQWHQTLKDEKIAWEVRHGWDSYLGRKWQAANCRGFRELTRLEQLTLFRRKMGCTLHEWLLMRHAEIVAFEADWKQYVKQFDDYAAEELPIKGGGRCQRNFYSREQWPQRMLAIENRESHKWLKPYRGRDRKHEFSTTFIAA